ncbi:phosphatidylserine lipase ABHD16A [Aethina tumida]|uniref:phosphatidylserine lipase ABHD16A n=1 Tax=Aethina tumida TaxID=116153 RepID=UPI00096AD9E3|nr:phosphatidylserine lipase ABHD16A [Aethina tumida]
MSALKVIWECISSPRLIKCHGGPDESYYQPSSIEKWGDSVITSFFVIWRISVYTSPLLIGILYQRGYFESENLGTLTRLVTTVGVILIASYCCKGLGRSQNPLYLKFLATWKNATTDGSGSTIRELKKYDYDFSAWPVDYYVTKKSPKSESNSSIFRDISLIPCRVIGYLAMHTFGIRLIYPGTIGFLKTILEPSLIQGRSRLVEIYHGERFKLRTVDGNNIDSIFIDKRNITINGGTLVICCEGNAGFYEIGIAMTPIDANYSVLGWNHPGFGGSTGRPYPSQEQNAIDAVVQFAINELGFKLENILFFGWSIGGYSSSWAAMTYPDCKGLILDATFDDILPLAENYMPSWFEPIVRVAIREQVNLNVAELAMKYPGPISLIRRTNDEVICLKEGVLESNRGNDLLIKLLQYRYPHVMEANQVALLRDYLALSGHSQDDMFIKFDVEEQKFESLIQSYVSEYSKEYPMKFGEEFSIKEKNQTALFLARRYLKDFKATHCINLPTEMFQLPWDTQVEDGFVLT